MDDVTRKAAADAVVEKFQDLITQRTSAVGQRSEIERRIRNIDRGLFDCRAAGRLFGVDIELPDDVRPGLIVRPNPARMPQSGSPAPQPLVKQDTFSFSARLPANNPSPAPTSATLVIPKVPSTLLDAGSEPSVRELILHYLKLAGPNGEKAAVLRRRVETFLNRQIHYKTIGMSLYRLSKETPPLVCREGQIWALANPWVEAKSPGAGTPGPSTKGGDGDG